MILLGNLEEETIKKINEAYSSEFIGDVVFDEEEIEDIKNEILNFSLKKDTKDFKDEIFLHKAIIVLVVQLAKNWGDSNDDNHFDAVMSKDIFNDEKRFGLIKKYLISTYEMTKKWLIDDTGANTKRYKQTFLYNAFSPVSSINGFIGVVLDAYNDEDNEKSGFFDEPYEVNPEPYLKFTKDCARNFKSVKDNEEAVNLYGVSYKLTAAMRHGFVQQTETIARLISRTINYIEQFYRHESFLDGTYYSRLVTNRLTTVPKSNTKRRNYEPHANNINKWWADYYFDNSDGGLSIKFPQVNLSENQDYTSIKVVSYCGEDVFDTKVLYVNKAHEYNKYINSFLIQIPPHILSKCDNEFNFRVDIYNNENDDELLFSTNESLYSSCLLFVDNSHYKCKDLYVNPKKEILAFIPTNMEKDISLTNYKSYVYKSPVIYLLEPEDNESLIIGENEYLFTLREKDSSYNIVGKEPKLPCLYDNGKQVINDVYKNIAFINIKPSLLFNEAKLISLEWTNFYKNEYNSKKEIFNDDLSKLITLSRDEYPHICSPGLNTLTFKNEKTNKKILSIKYYIVDISFPILPKNFITKDGSFEIAVSIEEKEIFNGFVSSMNKELILDIDEGEKIIVSLPYFEFNVVGMKDSEKIFLKQNNSLSVYKDRFLSLDGNYLIVKNNLNQDVAYYFGNSKIEEKYVNDECRIYLPNINSFKGQKDFFPLTIHFNHKDYKDVELMKIFVSELCFTDINNAFSLVYDDEEDKFFYNINNFIGRQYPFFRFELYKIDEDYENIEFYCETDILDSMDGEFTLPDFNPDLYNVRLSLYDSHENKIKILGNADIYLGDFDKCRFNNAVVLINKLSNKMKLKEQYRIKNIIYLGYENYPYYRGELCVSNQKHGKVIIFLYKKGAIEMYLNDTMEEKLRYDNIQRKISYNINENLEEIRSAYIDVEEEEYV